MKFILAALLLTSIYCHSQQISISIADSTKSGKSDIKISSDWLHTDTLTLTNYMMLKGDTLYIYLDGTITKMLITGCKGEYNMEEVYYQDSFQTIQLSPLHMRYDKGEIDSVWMDNNGLVIKDSLPKTKDLLNREPYKYDSRGELMPYQGFDDGLFWMGNTYPEPYVRQDVKKHKKRSYKKKHVANRQTGALHRVR